MPEKFSFKQYYEQLNTIFSALVAIPLLLFIWLYLEASGSNITPIISGNAYNVVNFISSIGIFILIGYTFYLFRKGTSQIEANTLQDKLQHYKKLSIKTYVLLNIAGAIAVAGFYLVVSNTFVALYVIVLVLLSLLKPTTHRIVKILKLKGAEKDRVLKKND